MLHSVWSCVALLDVAGSPASRAVVLCSALALLVVQVVADHHDPAVAADHLALVADLLDAGLDLHIGSFRRRIRARALGTGSKDGVIEGGYL